MAYALESVCEKEVEMGPWGSKKVIVPGTTGIRMIASF